MTRRSRLIVILIVVTVSATTLFLAWTWLISPSPAPEIVPFEPAEMTTVVRYDGVSFHPAAIRVTSGTKVYFLNQSGLERPMYVASDDHPTHQKYPGFDAAVVGDKFPAAGESFEFVFEKKGQWGYHDHNNPPASARVIVE